MTKRILIAGASGMVGQLVLDKGLASPEVSEVVSLVRTPSSRTHAKLTEIPVQDFNNYSSIESSFEAIDAAFFCIGVYTGQVPDQQFKEITVDFAVKFAEALKAKSPQAKLCLLSGAGADRTEKSKLAFAKYKGMAENRISSLGLEFYSLRPGYIYPVTPRKEPSLIYAIFRWLYPLLKPIMANSSITSEQLAQAMLTVGLHGAKAEILENTDIREYS